MTLQSRLAGTDFTSPPGGTPTLADPVAFLRRLASSGRFHRDSGFGRIYHPGSVSLRENSPTDSLHVVVRGDHVSAHVDRVSPLDKAASADQASRYSVQRAAVHNLVGAAQDLVRLLRGRKGDHRSHLECEWVWDAPRRTPDPSHLLDPGAWSVHVEVRVDGSLDEGRLVKALDAVLGHRPADHEVLDVVQCDDDAQLERARAEVLTEPVAMTDWPPLRLRLARHPAGDVVLVNVNHAAADGFGAMSVLEAIAEAYSDGAGGRAPFDFLAGHDLPVRPASAPVSTVAAVYRGGVERVRDALARPARIAPDQAVDEPGYGFHFVRLSVEDTRRVANVHRQGTARNVLLAGLHLAIGDWNLEHGTPGRRIGVLVPVDLRPPEWPAEVVANFSVTARVSTSRRHRSGHRAALKAITGQKTRNKRFRTGVALLAALERNGLLGLWAKQSLVVLQPLTRNREVDTAMLANVGWLDTPPSFGPDPGDATEVWFSSPARTPRCLCIGAVTVAGRLHLTLRYPHRLFGADAARRFADLYVEHIVSVAERRW
ncbi:MAG TPA: hypothetical protein VHT97_04185 [Acidimicrobiales bacterium]|nr:hypothetical protein [Acidimicrobiales bacterium]